MPVFCREKGSDRQTGTHTLTIYQHNPALSPYPNFHTWALPMPPTVLPHTINPHFQTRALLNHPAIVNPPLSPQGCLPPFYCPPRPEPTPPSAQTPLPPSAPTYSPQPPPSSQTPLPLPLHTEPPSSHPASPTPFPRSHRWLSRRTWTCPTTAPCPQTALYPSPECRGEVSGHSQWRGVVAASPTVTAPQL